MLRNRQVWVVYAATWGNAAAEGNVWAQEPTKAGICVDVCDLILLKAIWMPMVWATT